MDQMTSLQTLLFNRLAPAFESIAREPVDPVVRRSQHADFQVDGALPLARRLGRPPREIAAEVLRLVDLSDLADSVAVSGPGFINVTVADATIAGLLEA